jgi:hypothetical protein
VNRDGFKATYSNFGAGATIATVGGDDDERTAVGPVPADDGLLALANDGCDEVPAQPASRATSAPASRRRSPRARRP